MKDLEKLKKKLKSVKPHLKEEYGVKEIGIFGSYARGEQTEGSDLDVIVTFKEPISLFELIRMENELSDRLELEVDLVTKTSLKPHIQGHVNKEVVYA